jgi:hypothetical protein
MPVEQFRGYVAAIVAALCVVGGGAALIYLWQLPPVDPPRELTLIYGLIGSLIGAGTTFLFVSEGASRATNAAERSFASGSVAGAAAPEQVTTVTPSSTTIATGASPNMNVGAEPGGPPPAPLDDAAGVDPL